MEADRLTSIHEAWHDRLQFTTIYGLLIQVLWAMGDASGDDRWSLQADALLDGAIRTHEEFASWMTELLAGPARASLRTGYPLYAGHADRARQRIALSGSDYVLAHAINAVYRTAMQPAMVAAAVGGPSPRRLEQMTAAAFPRTARPDHRLRVLSSQLRRHGWGDALASVSGGLHTIQDYADQADDVWEHVSRCFYERCVTLLRQAGCETLPYEGQLAYADALHERAVGTIGSSIRLVPASASTEGSQSDADVVLRAVEAERLKLRTPLPATMLGPDTAPAVLISGRGDAKHLFVAIRPTARVRTQYILDRPLTSPGRFVALVRSSQRTDGPRTVAVLDVTDRPVAELTAAGVPVLTSISMSALADDSVRSRWAALLSVGASTVLVDVSPTRHLRLWLSTPNHLLRYAIVRYQAADRIVVAVVWQLSTPSGARSRLHIAITTPTYAAALEVWLDSHPDLRACAVRDDSLADQHETLLTTTIGHLLAEEPYFDFQAGADG